MFTMKKHLFFFLLSIGIFTSCEKDDFCTQTPVTPNLVIRFYNKDDLTKTKSVSNLSIIAQSKTDSLYRNLSTDSIAIPLNSAAGETVYTFKMNDADGKQATNKIATLTIKYSPNEDYISRSCGFRYIFKDVTFEASSPSWIDRLSTNQVSEITHQNQAHVQIFH